MAEGIYSSHMSCWERNKKGLKADNAGPTTIKEDVEQPVAPTVIGEVVHAPLVPVLNEVDESEEDSEEAPIVYGIADEEGYLAFDGKTWKTKKGVEAAFKKVDEGVGFYIIEVPA